jgi:hypothetical protein
METKICTLCGKPFNPLVGNQIKCTTCRKKHKPLKPAHIATCVVCGKKFSTALYNKVYCSRNCRNKFHYIPVPVEHICKLCGKKFMSTKSNKKYCSDYCSLQGKLGSQLASRDRKAALKRGE